MKLNLCLLVLLTVAAARLGAQVSVEILLEQEQFLRDETFPVKVRITNRSGQPLQLGKQKNWLDFSIESREGARVERLGDIPLEGELTLDSASAVARTIDLMPCFDLSQPGRYTVTATLKIPEWSEEIPSRPKTFEIVRGTKIWEQEFGVPVAGGPPEARKYALQQVPYMKDRKLYVRVTDLSEARVFKAFAAGSIVSFGRPEVQLDRESRLHLLFQTGARAFSYQIITPDGRVVLRQTHDYAETRPALKAASEGRIVVSGGQRRTTPLDLPPPSAATNDVQAPKS